MSDTIDEVEKKNDDQTGEASPVDEVEKKNDDQTGEASPVDERDGATRSLDSTELVPTEELLVALLTAAVREAVGRDDVDPRPGQQDLAVDVTRAMVTRTTVGSTSNIPEGQVVGAAPTGTGKSVAYLTPAMMMAATRQQRTVVSTESLSLQAQIIDKDAPKVAAAIKKVTGYQPTFAVLKGWGNYVCAQQAAATAAELAGMGPDSSPGPEALDALAVHVAGRKERLGLGLPVDVTVDGAQLPEAELVPLLDWALDAVKSQRDHHDKPADRHSYPGAAPQNLWDTVSTSPDACPGASKCPFGSMCAPSRARAAAASADVIVTNHSMLAVQAAHGASIILGNRRIGAIDHLVIDEAHTLPAQVRSQGGRQIDAWRINRAIKTFTRHVDTDPATQRVVPGLPTPVQLVTDGNDLAGDLDRVLSAKLRRARDKSTFGAAVVEIEPDDDPLDEEQLGDKIATWINKLTQLMPNEKDLISDAERMKVRRSRAQLASIAEDVEFIRSAGTDRARWYEDGNNNGRYVGASVKASPVDVSSLLRSRLWSADVPTLMEPGDVTNPDAEDRPDDTWTIPEYRWSSPPNGDLPPRYDLSVSCVSATINNAFAIDAGMSTKRSSYESPFQSCFDASALFVPRATSREDLDQVTRDPDAYRLSFDTRRHPAWASKMINELVVANGGSALVLSATSSAGRTYAENLRRHLAGAGLSHIHVYSQWDGPPPRMLLAQWKDDHDSIMVGTRSFMTGVDAPGQTCTLVIIDRVPRAAGNPVDDARVASLMEAPALDKWAADRLVYVSDSALLLDQGVGRLIRSTSDSGMVAILDPRLLKSGRLSYPEKTRKTLMEPLEKFATKLADLDRATEWLRNHRAMREAAK